MMSYKVQPWAIGTLVALALLLPTLFAGIASAFTLGTTAFTCSAAGPNDFKTDHCKSEDGAGEYGHVGFEESTEWTVTNAKTTSETTGAQIFKLNYLFSGVPFEFQATGISGSGTMENMKNAKTGEHTVFGSGTLHFSGVTVTAPAGKGCKVKTGEVTTNALQGTTAAIGMGLKIEPKEATKFAAIEIEGCSGSKALEALNGSYEVNGSVVLGLEGATLTFTDAGTTSQGTLSIKGSSAGVDGKATISARANSGQSYTPLAPTTVETKDPNSGTTGFTCGPAVQPNGSAGFSKSHCKPSDAVETNAAYLHTEVPANTATELIASNSKTASETSASSPLSIQATISGVAMEIKAAGVSAVGTMENMKDGATGEHTIAGTATATFTEVTVPKPGGGCSVTGGKIESKELRATTATQTDSVKLEPASGSVLASFSVTGCTNSSLNGAYEVAGSVKGKPEGATTTFTESATTAEKSLTLRGMSAGIEGTVTFASRVKGSGSNYTDLSPTTVPTE